MAHGGHDGRGSPPSSYSQPAQSYYAQSASDHGAYPDYSAYAAYANQQQHPQHRIRCPRKDREAQSCPLPEHPHNVLCIHRSQPLSYNYIGARHPSLDLTTAPSKASPLGRSHASWPRSPNRLNFEPRALVLDTHANTNQLMTPTSSARAPSRLFKPPFNVSTFNFALAP